MIFLKIFSIVIGLVVISKTIHDFKKGKEGLVMCLFWLLTWSGIIVIASFPYLIDKINAMIGGAGSGVNAFLGSAFVFLFFITYRIYIKANRLERQLHEIVMKIGLRQLDEK